MNGRSCIIWHSDGIKGGIIYGKNFLWGTGWRADQVLSQYNLDEQYNILGFIDNNKSKWGTDFQGKKIYGPEILKKEQFDMVLVLVDKYDEIINQIKGMFDVDADIRIENYKYFYKQELIKRYENCSDPEIQEVLQYIRKRDLQVFNYDFYDEYMNLQIDVLYDPNCGMYYVEHSGKRLYFARSMDNAKAVSDYYRWLLMEQDIRSSHRYVSKEFDVQKGDVVVDAGAAEGFFSLENIDKASKIYLIEAEKIWIEALEETFKDYRDKIVIIPKYITSVDNGKLATLDALIEEPVNFIKMDIEGNEWDALQGAKRLINDSNNLKCAVRSYHADFDETLIKDVLGRYGMECSTSPGYMWFHLCCRKAYVSTKLCRGIVRALKNREV